MSDCDKTPLLSDFLKSSPQSYYFHFANEKTNELSEGKKHPPCHRVESEMRPGSIGLHGIRHSALVSTSPGTILLFVAGLNLSAEVQVRERMMEWDGQRG